MFEPASSSPGSVHRYIVNAAQRKRHAHPEALDHEGFGGFEGRGRMRELDQLATRRSRATPDSASNDSPRTRGFVDARRVEAGQKHGEAAARVLGQSHLVGRAPRPRVDRVDGVPSSLQRADGARQSPHAPVLHVAPVRFKERPTQQQSTSKHVSTSVSDAYWRSTTWTTSCRCRGRQYLLVYFVMLITPRLRSHLPVLAVDGKRVPDSAGHSVQASGLSAHTKTSTSPARVVGPERRVPRRQRPGAEPGDRRI